MTQKPDHLLIPTDLAQALLNYLGTQPYTKVAALIAELQRCQPAPLAEQTPTASDKPEPTPIPSGGRPRGP